jgi:ATP-dependent Clp protease ATP-binding subunit ClpB
MDEACSNVRVELDSKPEVIDGMERSVTRLQVEQAALQKEKDQISLARLEAVSGVCICVPVCTCVCVCVSV